MTHNFRPLNDGTEHDAYEILLQGSPDEQKFGRVFPDVCPDSHRLAYKVEVVKDGEVRRKRVTLWLEPLPLEELSARTNRFASLSIVELRALAQRYKLELPASEGKPDATREKEALVEMLRAFKPPKTEKPPSTKAAATVIPESVHKLDDAGLEVEMAKHAPLPAKWASMPRAQREAALVKAMSPKNPV